MGVYFKNYLGAFIVIQNKEIIVQEERRICSVCNKDHTRSSEEYNFCHSCGGVIENNSIEVTEVWSGQHEIYENDDLIDVLYFPEYPNSDKETYGFANNSKSKAVIDVGDDEYSSITELESINIDDLKESFREEYKEILELLDKEGFEYEIKFGLCRIGN